MYDSLIVKMVFGSHLYGTDTKESDRDYKGIFFPTFRDVAMCEVEHSRDESIEAKNLDGKNTKHAIDYRLMSLQKFIDKACDGDIMAFDMLHAPASAIISHNYVWALLQTNRERFYTSNPTSFIGYAGKQAAKYGIKGSRLQSANKLLELVASYEGDPRIEEIMHLMDANDEYIEIGLDQINVLGKQFSGGTRVSHLVKSLTAFIRNYGERARKAERNEGIDWKAVSHAIRCCLQVKELYTEGAMSFPLRQAAYIRQIKLGEYDYNTIGGVLEALLDETRELAAASNYPEEVDRGYWERFILDVAEVQYGVGHKAKST